MAKKGGVFYLYGEHDNMNNFISKNQSFNNDSIHQHEPWSYNRPCMITFFRNASMKDPFFCNNLGSTIKKETWVIPLVWRYNKVGIPKIIIGKKIYR